jgi:hypothetical protein
MDQHKQHRKQFAGQNDTAVVHPPRMQLPEPLVNQSCHVMNSSYCILPESTLAIPCNCHCQQM